METPNQQQCLVSESATRTKASEEAPAERGQDLGPQGMQAAATTSAAVGMSLRGVQAVVSSFERQK